MHAVCFAEIDCGNQIKDLRIQQTQRFDLYILRIWLLCLGCRKQSLTIAAAAAATSVSMDIALAGSSPKASRGGSEENVHNTTTTPATATANNNNNNSSPNVNAKDVVGRNPSITTVTAELHVPAVNVSLPTTTTAAAAAAASSSAASCPCCASCCPIAQAYGAPAAVSHCNGQSSPCPAATKEGGGGGAAASAAAAVARRRSGEVMEVDVTASGGDGKTHSGRMQGCG